MILSCMPSHTRSHPAYDDYRMRMPNKLVHASFKNKQGNNILTNTSRQGLFHKSPPKPCLLHY
uniref:Uncharacterized protein n=1 Tax=Arundo donax TaxID=35708 RepID=A0A0A9CFY0_ARUDO